MFAPVGAVDFEDFFFAPPFFFVAFFFGMAQAFEGNGSAVSYGMPGDGRGLGHDPALFSEGESPCHCTQQINQVFEDNRSVKAPGTPSMASCSTAACIVM